VPVIATWKTRRYRIDSDAPRCPSQPTSHHHHPCKTWPRRQCSQDQFGFRCRLVSCLCCLPSSDLHYVGRLLVGWMCGVGLHDGVQSGRLRGLGLDDKVSMLQQGRLRWRGRELQSEDSGWVDSRAWSEIVGGTVRHVNWVGRCGGS